MTNALSPSLFSFGIHSIRVVSRNGEPWFVASDVAEALEYRDAANAARNVSDHQKGTQIVSTLGGEQKVTIINESGLYKLVLRSRKPEAELFSDWVTGEVLPSIRKTGSYNAQPTTISLLSRRWLVYFDDQGKEQVSPIEDDGFVATRRNIAQRIRERGMDSMFDIETVSQIAHACTERLVADITHYRAYANNLAKQSTPSQMVMALTT